MPGPPAGIIQSPQGRGKYLAPGISSAVVKGTRLGQSIRQPARPAAGTGQRIGIERVPLSKPGRRQVNRGYLHQGSSGGSIIVVLGGCFQSGRLVYRKSKSERDSAGIGDGGVRGRIRLYRVIAARVRSGEGRRRRWVPEIALDVGVKQSPFVFVAIAGERGDRKSTRL